jgi:iron complex transport system substrate-binding protein
MKHLLLAVLIIAVSNVWAEISLVDDTGRAVVLEKPAQRIVALAPHIVENLYSVGAGNRIVGAVSYSDFPEEASSIPNVGSHNAFSLETIVGLNPDLIIAWHSGNDNQVVDRLRSLGYPLYISEPRKLEDIAQALINMGKLTGNEQSAKLAADDFMATLQRLRSGFNQQSVVSVFYQIWNEPLQTLSDDHLVSDVIRVCGGSNIFADALSLAPKINIESVIERDPQVIVAAGMGGARPDWLDDWHDWKGLWAVRDDNLFFIHPDLMHRHTTRILLGAQLMCQHLDAARSKVHLGSALPGH